MARFARATVTSEVVRKFCVQEMRGRGVSGLTRGIVVYGALPALPELSQLSNIGTERQLSS